MTRSATFSADSRTDESDARPDGFLCGGRAPALPFAVALGLGILIDRNAAPGALVWLGAAIGALWFGRLADRRSGVATATALLLLACTCVGGMRHHLCWSAVAPEDVSRYAHLDANPATLVGVIESAVAIDAADRSGMTPPWMQIDRSRCELRCERLIGDQGDRPTTGTLRMLVTGHLLHAGIGDRVQVTGRLIEPRGVQNPGGFDYRSHLRSEGVRCLLSVDHPDAVRVIEPRVDGRVSRQRAELRDRCESILVHHLDPRSASLAMSLMLGERSSLPDDVRDAFTESGTVHVLAISGLHVGILATLLLVICRLLNVSAPITALVVVVGVLAYAFVTDHRPPVIRASVLAVTAAAGWPWFRRAGGVNLIAICGAVVLLINPTDLFDVGTQLSFLAVTAIGWAATVIAHWRNSPWRSLSVEWAFTARSGFLHRMMRLLAEGYVVSGAIWLFTLPLVAARFHLAAPVGFLLNVLLLPFVAVVLWLGFLTLGCGLLAPWIVRWPAAVFDWSLRALNDVVSAAARWNLGHASVAGPEEWWLIAFYALLLTAVVVRWGHPLRRWAWRGVGVLAVVGLALPLSPDQRDGLRCMFLSVGHGCAVVLELPGGETLLYDAGSFSSARRGEAVVAGALWERGISRIDGIIVSHADVDHFNAAAGILQTMPVGMLLFHQSFLDFAQQSVALLCDAAGRRHVPIRLLQENDQIRTERGDVDIEVLHPPAGWAGRDDNANSLVLRIRYAGRTLLLTGDLEREGLAKLLESPAEPIDLLLSPHHGSVKANPASLAEWASPQHVVVSGGSREAEANLRQVYADARQVVSTARAGAITAHVSPSGEMTVKPWRAE